jgi:hypothetical protein
MSYYITCRNCRVQFGIIVSFGAVSGRLSRWELVSFSFVFVGFSVISLGCSAKLLTGTLTLTICIVSFHLPRGAAIEWIIYILTLQFWFTLILIAVWFMSCASSLCSGLLQVAEHGLDTVIREPEEHTVPNPGTGYCS